MKLQWKSRVAALSLVSAGMFAAQGAHAADKQLTLCWASWDPANALVELSKDFTAKTGIQMKFEFVPWPNFAERFVNELNSHGKLCDVLIGDSQWIGLGATQGHYVELTDFFKKSGIKMADFMPATVEGYTTWPKHSQHYWALPAMGDAAAWTYRKDWFARPELRAEFKKKYGRELEPPKTWDELVEVGKFFQGRVIDGKKVYGAAIWTERGSEGITMGVANTMYAYGMDYDNPKKPYQMKGYINGPGALAGLKLYKTMYDSITPPGHSNAYMTENLDAYKSGQVAMQMQWIAFFPGISKDPNVGGDKTGFFPMPKGKYQYSQLGGQGISVVSYSSKKDLALQYIKWFAQPATQKRWWEVGGFTCLASILNAPGFTNSTPYAKVFLDSMKMVKDFWQEPSYMQLLESMQKRVHDYVVAGKGTPQTALDSLEKDWEDVFKEDGKL
jgi:multiple sugar transport system substrate-binding protein